MHTKNNGEMSDTFLYYKENELNSVKTRQGKYFDSCIMYPLWLKKVTIWKKVSLVKQWSTKTQNAIFYIYIYNLYHTHKKGKLLTGSKTAKNKIQKL